MTVKSYLRYTIIGLFTFSMLSIIPVTAQNGTNLLLNGSFEIEAPPGNFKTLRTGNTIAGWEVMRGTVDLTGTYFKAFDGNFSMDMNGTPGTGAIEQKFFTEKGKKYLLSFYMAGNCGGGPRIKRLMVYVGNEARLFEFDTEGRNNQNMGWVKYELVFKATGRKTTLRFESPPDYEPSNWGATIDNVSVVRTSRRAGNSGEGRNFFAVNYGFLGGASYYLTDNNTLELVNFDANRYNLAADNAGIGLHLGGFAELYVGPVFIRPELRVSSVKINYSLAGAAANMKAGERYQHLEIPIALGLEIASFRVFVAPTGYLYLFKTGDLEDQGDFTSNIRTFTHGYEAGVGYNLSFANIDLRYAWNFSKQGDGLLINNSTKLYLTDMPDRLILTLSINLN